jgi:hypothetical protein
LPGLPKLKRQEEKSMATQLAKLGLVPGARWRVDRAPIGWTFETSPDPADEATDESRAAVVISFVTAAAQLAPTLERLEQSIFPAGALWIAWPRKAGGHSSDITDNAVRDAALARSLVDTKVAAIDADWSGLKLVWRVSARS